MKAVKSTNSTDENESPLMARAKDEMADAVSLMADMKAREALLKARNLKRDLKTELRKSTAKSGDIVKDYLDSLRKDPRFELLLIEIDGGL